MWNRVRVVLTPLLVGSLAFVLLGTTSSTTDGRRVTFSEAVSAAFWTGPPDAPPDCGTGCWWYEVTLTKPGYRLRAAIDRPRIGEVWQIQVFDPAGALVGSASPDVDLYSAEVIDPTPTLGTYRIAVRAQDVTEPRYRVRVGLDADDLLPDERTLVPPNLQPLPPWDFSFRYPVTNGLQGGESVGVHSPAGRVACHPEEVTLSRAMRCIRVSYGVANVGSGPLELQVGPGSALNDRPLLQHVRFSDGGRVTRGAGNAYYHHSHLHYHHDDAIQLELLEVVDAETGQLAPAGEPQRKGFAHRNELLRDWTTFYPVWPTGGFGLLPGWADYYEWDRPGNYIEFALNEDGLYVVRMTADPDGHILESDTSDNVAYSLFRVDFDDVEHLESGRGTDPWDPCRVPLPLGPEFQDSFVLDAPRPETCPN